MNKKQQRQAERAAKATVAARHKDEPKGQARASKLVVVALPKLPKLTGAAKVRKPKPINECMCGCGSQTRSKFAPGHNSFLKSVMLRVTRGATVEGLGLPEGVAARVGRLLAGGRVETDAQPNA